MGVDLAFYVLYSHLTHQISSGQSLIGALPVGLPSFIGVSYRAINLANVSQAFIASSIVFDAVRTAVL